MKIWNFAVKLIVGLCDAIVKPYQTITETAWNYVAYKHHKVTIAILACLYGWAACRLIFS